MTMKELKAQVGFVDALFINFMLSMKEHMENEKENQGKPSYFNKNYQNKNCGKYALKRKITMIRQELLNLEKLIERI
jgi:hypothetical protein